MTGSSDIRDPLAWELPKVAVGYADDVAGRGPLQNRIARVVSRALRDARDDRGVSRTEVARRMADELGRRVTEDMIEKWASEASEAHRIPLDAFIALIAATGADELLGFVPGLRGFVVVPRRYKAVIDLQLLEEHERDVAAHKAKLLSDLRGTR
jgi:hypothetical protein